MRSEPTEAHGYRVQQKETARHEGLSAATVNSVREIDRSSRKTKVHYPQTALTGRIILGIQGGKK